MLHTTLSVLTFSFSLLIASEGLAAEKRRAQSHVHGAAEINIIVEGKRIVVEFHAPSESVMGFEQEAKSESERKKRDAALKLIREKFSEMVILERKAGCRPEGGKVAIVQSDSEDKKHSHSNQKMVAEHREVRATFNFECEQNPSGSRVQFGVTRLFPSIHEVKVRALSDAKQTGATITKDKGEVRL
jgi:Protein of unknown function (DUF2796)